MVCKWRDCRDVLMISKKRIIEVTEVGNKHGQSREKLNIACGCNEGMSGID